MHSDYHGAIGEALAGLALLDIDLLRQPSKAQLGELAGRGINLTKLESRPRRNRPWHYVFYVDLEGHWQDAGVNRALMGLLTRTAFLKLLGSYPAAE